MRVGEYAKPALLLESAAGGAMVITDVLDATVEVAMNGVQLLRFTIPRESTAGREMTYESRIYHEADEYRARIVEFDRQGQLPIVRVTAEAAFYDLAFGVLAATDYDADYASGTMAGILAGSGWQVGTVEVPGVQPEWRQAEGSPLECLRSYAEHVGGWLRFRNREKAVDLLLPKGDETAAVAFTWGRNVTHSKRVIDTSRMFTRVYGQDIHGVTFASVNGGQRYLEDHTFSDDVRATVVKFEAGTPPQVMLDRCRGYLSRVSMPTVSYELSLLDHSAWEGHEGDAFEVGDMVAVTDVELGIRTVERVESVSRDLIRPWLTTVQLENRLSTLEHDVETSAPEWTQPEAIARKTAEVARDTEQLKLDTDDLKFDTERLGTRVGDLDTRATGLDTGLKDMTDRVAKVEGRLGDFVVAVKHGSNADTPRPAGAPLVIWFGTVTPRHTQPGDIVWGGEPQA